MSSQNKHSRHLKSICVRVLGAVLWMCILLILCTIGLQAYNLVFPPIAETENPALIGEVTIPFRLTTATFIPFLMLPLLALVFVTLFLQRFFAQNGFGYSDKIPVFDKHPHTRFGKKACKRFMYGSFLVSFVLCLACTVVHQLYVVWFGLIVVAIAGYLHSYCAKMMRHRRRLYHHNKKKTKESA